jgi:hypothetical protein
LADVAEILSSQGYFVSQLNCESSLQSCYNIAVAPKLPRVLICALCRSKNLKAYIANNHRSIGEFLDADELNPPIGSHRWGHSSAATIGRFESAQDYESHEFIALRDKMSEVAINAFKSAAKWIREEKLDRIIVFNGRIDATRGVIEAAKFCNIPFFTAERAAFGFGLLILPNESCLGLATIGRLMEKCKGIPLGKSECEKIVSVIKRRFNRSISAEWRVYNVNHIYQTWPQNVRGPRVLILPSSTNEISDEPDWSCGWNEGVEAFDQILNYFKVDGVCVVVRCHPNWSETIHGVDGRRIEGYYKNWAEKRGLNIYLSNDKASTLSLIEQADVIIVNGGSSALEAGVLGKCIISTRPSSNYDSSFVINVHQRSDLDKIADPLPNLVENFKKRNLEIARATIRYYYAIVFRLPSFINSAISQDPTDVKFNLCEFDRDEFLDLIQNARKNISVYSDCLSPVFEDECLSLLLSRDNSRGQTQSDISSRFKSRSPRGIFKIVIWLRCLFSRGDRWEFGLWK